jgi:hypothetical protein
MAAASAFAYIADGRNGMRIVQVFAPTDNPNYFGFSPKPTTKLTATYPTKGVERDRAADESGNQLAVFNRRGSRPFNRSELLKLFVHEGWQTLTVTNQVPGVSNSQSGDK